MAITHEERSHSAARPHNKCGRALAVTRAVAKRHGSLPPNDADASAPGVADRHGFIVTAIRSQFLKHNVI